MVLLLHTFFNVTSQAKFCSKLHSITLTIIPNITNIFRTTNAGWKNKCFQDNSAGSIERQRRPHDDIDEWPTIVSMKSVQLSKFISKFWSPCWKCENIGNVRMGEREWHKMWDNWESTNVTFAQGDEEGETVGQDVSTSLEGFRFACDLWWHAFSKHWWLFHTQCNGILVPFCLCPFHCDLCSKMFTSSSLHSRHIQIHSS